MKYWNKDKNVRQKCWTKVTLTRRDTLKQVSGGWINTSYAGDTAVKRWCQQQESTGKFYSYFGADGWWFEHEQDAIMFTLKWS